MFRIDRNNNMYITKGDDGSFDLELTEADGSKLTDGSVVFTVRHANNLDSTIINSTSGVIDGKVTFTIGSSVTNNLSRKKYVYDLAYTGTDGKKNTFLGGESNKLAFWVM